MNKILILLLIFLPLQMLGQKTYYYQLRKMVHNRVATTNVSGGQFITFSGGLCFESNKNGVGVGHGTMKRRDKYSTSGFVVYIGESYWGKDATFKFTNDLATLNVIAKNGDKFLYKRVTPPASVTTCSLIRKPSSSGGGGSSGGGVIPVQPINPIGGGGYYPGGGSTGGGSGRTTDGSTQPQRERKWRDCSLCNGKGTIIRDSPTPAYGVDRQVYCSQCGRSYYASSGHSHITCPTCHGQKGFWSE